MRWLDFVIAALIGFIDLNPLPDLVGTPLAWLLLFVGGN
jgi:hypothetical protein